MQWIVTVRMNYNLDDEAYQLLQLSEGYMARMCSSLDELIQPLSLHLAPRLSDATVLGLISLAAKRIESAIRRVRASFVVVCIDCVCCLCLHSLYCCFVVQVYSIRCTQFGFRHERLDEFRQGLFGFARPQVQRLTL